MTCFLLTDYDILPKKELHWSLWVNTATGCVSTFVDIRKDLVGVVGPKGAAFARMGLNSLSTSPAIDLAAS